MKRFVKIVCILSICIFFLSSLGACVSSNQDGSYDEYHYGYSDGYDKGYEEGWDDLFDVLNDELEAEKEEKDELLGLIFEAVVYNGEQYSNGEPWQAGGFELKYFLDGNSYLHFYIRGLNIKDVCNNLDDYADNLPIACYVGSYDEDGDFVVLCCDFV